MMKVFFSAALIVSASALAALAANAQISIGNKSSVDEGSVARKAAWEKFLISATKGMGSVMLEFREGEAPPSFIPSEGLNMERLAFALGREWVPVGNVSVLRRPSTKSIAASAGSIKLLDWIGKLSNEDRKALFGAGLSADRLEPEIVDQIARLSGDSASLMRSQMATKPFTVQLKFAAEVEYPHEGGSRSVSLPLLEERSSSLARPNDPRRTLFKGDVAKTGPTKAEQGSLKWPEGHVRDLPSLVREVGRSSRVWYVLDERQKDELIFVQGRMTLSEFNDAIAKLTEVPSVLPNRNDDAASIRFGDMLSKELASEIAAAGKQVDLTNVRKGGTMTGGELAQEFPWLKARLEGSGLGDSVQGRVRLGLCAVITVGERPGLASSYQTPAFP